MTPAHPSLSRIGATSAVIALLSLAVAACVGWRNPVPPSWAPSDEGPAERGIGIAQASCASCHAVGFTDDSPMPAAPPLREVARRRDLVALEGDFAQGLVTAHPDMPAFIWRAAEIDDLIAYLESLRVEEASRD